MKKTERVYLFFVVFASGFAIALALADLLPDQISPSYNRGQPSLYYSTNNYLGGATLLVTNAIAYSDAAGAVPQDLTGLGGYLTVANVKTEAVFAITAQAATVGTFTAMISLPTNGYSDCGVWLTLTNAAGLSFTYLGENRLHVRKPYQ